MEEPNSPLIPGLADDVALQCISRMPLDDRVSLSLVSKSWFHAFASGKVYEVNHGSVTTLTCENPLTVYFLFLSLFTLCTFDLN